MTEPELTRTLSHITLLPDWQVRVCRKGDGWLVQIVFDAPDSDNPNIIKPQYCRKWYVSSHATTTEVVRTVYKAGLAALEHEYDEAFKFHGVAIYHPHRDVFDVLNVDEVIRKDVRK